MSSIALPRSWPPNVAEDGVDEVDSSWIRGGGDHAFDTIATYDRKKNINKEDDEESDVNCLTS